MNDIKVSILISNFNKEKYIEDCINSCLNQKYKNLEIIIFDNLSNDNSINIIRKFEEKININIKDRISDIAAANQIDILIEAFKISSGELICFLDSDDFFIPEKITTVVQKFSQDKNLDILFDIPAIKKKGNIRPLKIKKKINQYIWPSTIPTSGISLKKDYFEKCLNIDLFSNYPRVEMDLRLNFFSQRITKNFKIIDDYLTFYREVEGGIMTNSRTFTKKWWLRRIQAHNFIKNIYQKNNIKYPRGYDFFLTKLIVNFLSKG